MRRMRQTSIWRREGQYYWEWWKRWWISQENGENEEREAPGITGHGQDMMWNPHGGELKRRASPFLRGASRTRCGAKRRYENKMKELDEESDILIPWFQLVIWKNWTIEYTFCWEYIKCSQNLIFIQFLDPRLNNVWRSHADAEVTQRLRGEMSAKTVKTRKHLAPH